MKKFKKAVSSILAVIMILSTLSASVIVTNAATVALGSCGDDLIWTLDEDGTLTISGSGDINPAAYDPDTMTIKSIWSEYNIKNVIIEEGVTGIGSDAFSGTSLISVTIPDTVTHIDEGAFFQSSLESVKIPGNVENISGSAFGACHELREVTIGEGVKVIEEEAFYRCYGLRFIKIPSSIEKVESQAFQFGVVSETMVVYFGTEEDWNNIERAPDAIYNSAAYILFCDISNSMSGPCEEGTWTLTEDGNFTISGSYGDNITWIWTEDGTLILSGSGDMIENPDYYGFGRSIWWRYYIKDVIIEEGITGIGKRAFNCTSLTSVTIPATVTHIDYRAFSSSQLESVNIPGSVEIIGEDAFFNCKELREVTINEGVKVIGVTAFYDCYSLELIRIPLSVEQIGYYALQGGYGIKIIYFGTEEDWNKIDRNAKAIDDSAKIIFYDTNIIASGTYGANITWILTADGTLTLSGSGDMSSDIYDKNTMNSIWSKYYVKDVIIEAGITGIGKRAFYDTSLTSVTIPTTVTHIDEGAFCFSQLERVNIPGSVEIIGEKAFLYCRELREVTISEGVKVIERAAFYRCLALDLIKIPSSVEKIGGLALCSIGYDAKILYFGTEADWNKIDCDADAFDDAAEIIFYDTSIIASGTCGDYLTWTLDDNGILTISGTGEMYDYTIDNYIFAPLHTYRKAIKAVMIENGTTSIGDYAFYGCNSLTSVAIPNSVTSIGSKAFDSCTSLTSITIPDSVTSIGKRAFRKCNSLTSIDVDSNNKAYSSDDGVLFNKSKTELIKFPDAKSGEYVIPDSVTSIGEQAFYYCNSLTSVTISDGVTSIGDDMFYHCTSLISVTIPDSVTSIGDSAFSNCSALTSVNIPNSVTSISQGMFSWCSSLISVTIPDSVTKIENDAFARCTSLTSVTIPGSVTRIGIAVFYKCSSLTSVTILDGVTNIDNFAFDDCISLTSITIPNSVTSIGFNAFGDCASLTDVYYTGTEKEWSRISIDQWGNDALKTANVHYNTVLVPQYTQGDINGDRIISTKDSNLLKRAVLGKSPVTGRAFDAADLNGDGLLNTKDSFILKKMLIEQ